MKRYLHTLIIVVTVLGIGLIPGLSIAKDYPVTFLKETYKTQAPGTGGGKVYHTWAVESEKGNRLLILTGDDTVKRQWLRDFVKTGNTFIITVPSKETGQFETETIFKINVTNIHPVDESFMGEKKKGKKKRRK
ncbi:MAG: hypothetical protein [Olavius algarvensis Delta 4 endosymbiont]|nr:MAG: hypothetical protein [Olavius algarvensis Delta 4 endosymbiont]